MSAVCQRGAGWLVGVDSGGTFTDLVVLDPATGAIDITKVPSTPDRPVDAVRAAVERVSGPNVERLVHGTTVATNAILERSGADVCLLTTAGFEDLLSIQRLNRRYAFDLNWEKPAPLVPRRRTIGVHERVGPRGAVVEPLSEAECARVVGLVRELVERGEVGGVAICFLFAFANDAHERLLERRLTEELPGLAVSLSSRVSPVWKEYERLSTTVADAYIRPLMAGYLRDLVAGVSREGRFGPVLLLKSNGGTSSPESIVPAPVTTIHSGLAGGALGGAYFAAAVGEERCITLDIGGTSTDVGLVHDGSVGQLDEFEIEWGLPVVTPTVDVRAVGAGGGSIAYVDAGGLLQVGPASAGAVPGPAAYGLGGSEATVTDANVVLGRIDPAYFLGGSMRLDPEAAARAVERVGVSAGLGPRETASAIVRIANENVANAIRLLTIERGIDPRDYALVAFGGAGPLHACGVAEALDVERVVVPPHPGVCSAFGAAIAPLQVDRVWSLGSRSDKLDERSVRAQFQAAERDAGAELDQDGAGGEAVIVRSLACRYHLQNYEEAVRVPDLEDGFLERAAAAFHARYRAAYGYAFDGEAVEVVNCKVTARRESGLVGRVRFAEQPSPAPAGARSVVGDDGVPRRAAIERRGHLAAPVEGPAVFEEHDSTTFLPAGWTATSGPAGTLLLRRVKAS